MFVYLVAHVNWEVHEILSGWTTREAADAEAARLNADEPAGGEHLVEELELDVAWTAQTTVR